MCSLIIIKPIFDGNRVLSTNIFHVLQPQLNNKLSKESTISRQARQERTRDRWSGNTSECEGSLLTNIVSTFDKFFIWQRDKKKLKMIFFPASFLFIIIFVCISLSAFSVSLHLDQHQPLPPWNRQLISASPTNGCYFIHKAKAELFKKERLFPALDSNRIICLSECSPHLSFIIFVNIFPALHKQTASAIGI